MHRDERPLLRGGDLALVDTLEGVLGSRHRVAAGAVVTRAGARVASLGAGVDAEFEIGSISKCLTGLLYADALRRGEIERTTTLGDVLDIGPCPAARVSLQDLSTHRSGLPRLPRSAVSLGRVWGLWRHGANPYGDSLQDLLGQAREVAVGRPRPRYSTFGYELLGHALAGAAGTTYTELARTRLVEPLGLSSTYAPSTAEELRPAALVGSRRGRPMQPWVGEALAPAGGWRSSITDMARLAAALLDGSAPGVAALEPVADLAGPAVRIGAAWMIMHRGGRQITWHNGGTGGFRSWVGLDRDAGNAVVLLSATAASVDRHGFTLLDRPRGST
ncbi:MAG TPA: serine hydrolase domain-containing protein [Actinotalea sp.]|nr:serine hydrolase domain-containing protein [Actinotalea sp.]